MTELSIIIPAYNERARIGATLAKIRDYLKIKHNESYEIIVVDDGSVDDTSKIAAEFTSGDFNLRVFKNEINRGKGYSVRRGVIESDGDYILFSDADLSTPIEEYDKLRAVLDADSSVGIAIGSRALKSSQIIIHQPFYREWMGKIFNKIARVLTFKKIKDSQCGFKLFRKETAKKIFELSRVNGFAFDAEIIFLAQKMGFGVREIPVRWINSPNSRVNPVKDSLKMFFEILKIRWWWLTGKYKK